MKRVKKKKKGEKTGAGSKTSQGELGKRREGKIEND